MFETTFHLHAASVLAPGLSDLAALGRACRQEQVIDCEVPFKLAVPEKLPPNERRRASQAVRLVLACVATLESQLKSPENISIGSMRSVFASNDGTGEVSQLMFDELAGPRNISPRIFPNSVHNAAAGYFSIAYQNTKSSTVVSRGKESFAAGLLCAVLDAITQAEPVLLVCFDPAMTGPMLEQLDIRYPAACALVVSTDTRVAPRLASYRMKVQTDQTADDCPSWLPVEWSENSATCGFVALSLALTKFPSKLYLSLGSQTVSLEII